MTYHSESNRNILLNNNNYVQVQITPKEDTIRVEVPVKIHYIPVIFLPGIMGSNLKEKKEQTDTCNAADKEFVEKYLWNFDIPESQSLCGNQTAIKES